MPITPTYPGVYVEEIPSGVHTIIGVSTSETAFVDFFPQGPLNVATRITSFGDFQRRFGGLDTRSEASYAIQQYFLNGGQVAWVVRIAVDGMTAASGTLAVTPSATAPPDPDPDPDPTPAPMFTVTAITPGGWGNSVRVAVDDEGIANDQKAALFNLTVQQVVAQGSRERVVAQETYRRLSMDSTAPSFAPTVVNRASSLIRVDTRGVTQRPGLMSDGKPQVVTLKNGNDQNPAATGDDILFKADGSIGKNGHALLANAVMGRTPTTEHPYPGLQALDRIAPYIFNILCLPIVARLDEESRKSVVTAAQVFCHERRAFYIVDPPFSDGGREQRTGPKQDDLTDPESGLFKELDGLRGQYPENAAIYVPALTIPDPLNGNRALVVGPSGTLAGVYARTDAERGVWKAPAGTPAALAGATVEHTLTDGENGGLNPLGFNALRTFPIYGTVCWGARTMDGADQAASEWKYVPVRRTALFIEESLYQGLRWAVFEPNDEPLWSQIRLNVGAFMHTLFRQGAFQGQTRRDAYFVKCDRETTTQNDINAGIVHVVVGFAPLKPAEFVIVQVTQMAGQIQT